MSPVGWGPDVCPKFHEGTETDGEPSGGKSPSVEAKTFRLPPLHMHHLFPPFVYLLYFPATAGRVSVFIRQSQSLITSQGLKCKGFTGRKLSLSANEAPFLLHKCEQMWPEAPKKITFVRKRKKSIELLGPQDRSSSNPTY